MSTATRNTIIRASEDYVLFDLSSIEYVTTAVISRHDWGRFTDADFGIALVMPVGTVFFDAYAARSIYNQSTGANIFVTINTVEADVLTDLQQGEAWENGQAFRITVSANRVNITEFDGLLTITVPFGGNAPVSVWHLVINGANKRLSAAFDEEHGFVTFSTNRLSVFVVETSRSRLLRLRQLLQFSGML